MSINDSMIEDSWRRYWKGMEWIDLIDTKEYPWGFWSRSDPLRKQTDGR